MNETESQNEVKWIAIPEKLANSIYEYLNKRPSEETRLMLNIMDTSAKEVLITPETKPEVREEVEEETKTTPINRKKKK